MQLRAFEKAAVASRQALMKWFLHDWGSRSALDTQGALRMASDDVGCLRRSSYGAHVQYTFAFKCLYMCAFKLCIYIYVYLHVFICEYVSSSVC